ncbi:MAG TPA: ABC transporter permease [Nitrososphaerales archaeon]|nr:ABC transporter permease [Nitrososphaerales archaeon]
MPTVNAFRTLVVKEVRDIIKDKKLVIGMILVPLVIFPAMGAVINLSTQSAQTAGSSSTFAVMNLDGGNYSTVAVAYFSAIPNDTVTPIAPQSVQSAMKEATSQGLSSLVVIPPGFSDTIAHRRQATIDTYTTVSGFGVAQATSAGRLSAVVDSFGSYLTAYYLETSAPGLNSSVVTSPLTLNESSFLNGALINASPSAVTGAGLSQSFALPIATLIVAIFAMQIAATATAIEKEQKTLETLLTLPVSRFQILASKLLGSTVIAAVGAVTSIIGFSYYYSELLSSSSGSAVAVNLAPTWSYYAILGVLMFLNLAMATALAIVVSLFVSDVRGAQAIVGYFSFPIILPSLLVILGDFNIMPWPLKTALLAIPFSYVAIVSVTGLFGNYVYAAIGIVYLTAWIIASLYIASRIFNSERILTSGFTFGRRKKKQAET